MPYIKVDSAGVDGSLVWFGAPIKEVSTEGIRAMGEVGIDMGDAKIKLISPELVQTADVIVSMVDTNELPSYVPQAKIKSWDVPDPGGLSYDILQETRETIRTLVSSLAEELAEKTSVASFCILTDENNRALIQHRTADAPTSPNRWQLFGGAREGGESPRQNLTRELREELSLEIKPGEFAYYMSIPITDTQSVEIYHAYINSSAPITLHEGVGYEFIPRGNLAHYDFESNTQLALEKFYTYAK